jgi:hypothetical protein
MGCDSGNCVFYPPNPAASWRNWRPAFRISKPYDRSRQGTQAYRRSENGDPPCLLVIIGAITDSTGELMAINDGLRDSMHSGYDRGSACVTGRTWAARRVRLVGDGAFRL